MFVKEGPQVFDRDALLLHGVAVAHRYAVVGKGVVVDRDAEGGADGVLPAVAASDGVFLIVLQHEVVAEAVHDFACFLGQAVLFDQRQDGGLVGRQHGGQAEDGSRAAVGEGFLL